MKNTFTLRAMKLMFMLLLCVISIISCSENDEYKEFTDGSEIKYPGKIDSVRFNPGKERVQFQGILNSDPSIVEYKIFWNDGKDSVESNVEPASKGMPIENTFAVEEGTRNFNIYTYDEFGNISVPVTATGTSYGESYRRKLNNRFINSIDFDSTAAKINWEPMDLSTGAQYTEIVYPLSSSGENDTIQSSASESITRLEGLTKSETIKYRTVFRPKETSIDTFSVPFTDYFVRVVPQLKNRQVPFIASEVSPTNSRWGNLANWKSNDAIRSHDGYGGWDSWNGNIFNVETGFGGAPGITNGKLYQTLTLDPGSYTFEISDLLDTNLEPTDQAYLVVAAGDGLPDVDNVEDAIGYVKVYKRPVSGLKVIFTITEKTVVSLGFLTTQPGPPVNRFCNIRAFDFYFNEE